MFDQQKSVLAAVVLLAGGLAWSQPASAAHGERHYGSAWFELGGYYNSEDASRGEGILFAPLMHGENGMLFTDIRMKFFEDDVREGNFALGYRHMTGHGFNYGVWIGADIRESALDNSFNQLSGGFEALSHNLDFRLNWYGPGTDAKAGGAVGFTTVEIEGSNIFMIGGQEVLLQGVDAEIGIRLPVEKLNIDPNKFELRAYGGGFHFDDDDALEEVAGGKARITLAMNDIIPQLPGSRLTAEYEYSYDDVREDRHEVGGRLRIPLSDPGTSRALSSMSHQERRMMDGLERDTDVITARSKRENVEDALTNTDFDRVAMVNDGGSIEDTSTTAGDNSLLIVNGTVDDGRQDVQGNQTVQGGGSTIQVRGLTSGTMFGFAAPGSKPTVRNSGGSDVIRLLGDNTHIAGLLIDGNNNGGHGINGQGDKTNIAITQNMIIDTDDHGIRFGGDNSNILISGNMLSGIEDNGLNFGSRNSNVTIEDNTVDAQDDAIFFNDDNTNIVIRGNNLTAGDDDEGIEFGNGNSFITIVGNTIDAGDDGIFFDGADNDNRNTDITITGNTINSRTEDGIQFDDGNRRVVIANNTITAVEEGVEFDNDNSNVTISGNTITADDDEAIFFDNRNTRISILNNILSADSDDAIEFDNDNSNLTISGNTVTIAGSNGVDVGSANTNVSVLDNMISNVGSAGVNVGDSNDLVVVSGNTVTNTGANGVNIGNANTNVSVLDNMISNVGDVGVRFADSNDVVVVSGNTVTNAGGDAFFFFSDNTNLTVTNNIVAGNIGDDAFDMGDGFFGNNIIVNGAGNSAAGATIASDVCEGDGVFDGDLIVDGVVFNDAANNCS